MQSHSFLRVNVVSGLPGAGKSSVTRAAGAAPIPLDRAPDALPALLERAPHSSEIFVEAHPSIGPLEIASSLLGWTGSAGTDVAPDRPVRLGDLVTVLDASRFWSDLRVHAAAPQRSPRSLIGSATDASFTDSVTGHHDPDRTTGDALVEQIEWASVVVINKIDLAGRVVCEDIRDFVRLLNPASHVVFTRFGHGASESSIESWPEPRPDMYEWLQRSPGWVRQLNGNALMLQSPLGLSCVVYREPRPFHPARLAAFLAERAAEAGEILRSRGLFRLATRTSVVGSWNSAGPAISLEPTAMDGADPESPWGQEIAFFGRNLNAALLTANLDECLLSDEEFLAGPELWRALDDPFPEWETEPAD